MRSCLSISQNSSHLRSNMFVKITTIALIALIAIATDGAIWTGSTASWDLDTSTRFYSLPRNSVAARNEGWSPISGVNPPKGITPLCYQGDPTFCLLFRFGGVVGAQVAFPVAELDPEQPINWPELDVIIPKKLNGDELYYTSTVYFSESKFLNIRKISFQEKTRERSIPTRTPELLSTTDYKLKNCIPTMGTHYYTWDSSTDCKTLNPWSLLVNGTNVVGVLFQGFGNLTSQGTRRWWETIPPTGVTTVVGDPPACAVDAGAKFGIISLHFWFIKNPQTLTCG